MTRSRFRIQAGAAEIRRHLHPLLWRFDAAKPPHAADIVFGLTLLVLGLGLIARLIAHLSNSDVGKPTNA